MFSCKLSLIGCQSSELQPSGKSFGHSYLSEKIALCLGLERRIKMDAAVSCHPALSKVAQQIVIWTQRETNLCEYN
jgi:hypothetical protein